MNRLFLLLAVIFAALSTAAVSEHPHFRFLPAAVLALALAMLLGAW